MWGDVVPGGDASLLASGLDLVNGSGVPHSITGLFPAAPPQLPAINGYTSMCSLACVEVCCHFVLYHMWVLVCWWISTAEKEHCSVKESAVLEHTGEAGPLLQGTLL